MQQSGASPLLINNAEQIRSSTTPKLGSHAGAYRQLLIRSVLFGGHRFGAIGVMLEVFFTRYTTNIRNEVWWAAQTCFFNYLQYMFLPRIGNFQMPSYKDIAKKIPQNKKDDVFFRDTVYIRSFLYAVIRFVQCFRRRKIQVSAVAAFPVIK